MRAYRILEYVGSEDWVCQTVDQSLTGRVEVPSGSANFLTARTLKTPKECGLARRMLASMRDQPGIWVARGINQAPAEPRLIMTPDEARAQQMQGRTSWR